MSAYAAKCGCEGISVQIPAQGSAFFSANYSTWAVGFADNERRDETFAGADIGRRTSTAGGIGGVMAILTGLPFGKPDDILVIGAFGGDTTSHLRTNAGTTTNVNGPGAGINAIWMRGDFLRTSTFKADFFTIAPSTLAPTELGMASYNSLTNLNYRIEWVTGGRSRPAALATPVRNGTRRPGSWVSPMDIRSG